MSDPPPSDPAPVGPLPGEVVASSTRVRSRRPPAPAARPRSSRREEATLAAASAASAAVPALAVIAALGIAGVLAWPSLRAAPLGFFIAPTWDPAARTFGALPFLIGTLATSAIALAIAAPVGLGAALFLTEVAPRRARAALDVVLDVVAAVPSVVWGLFALDVLLPLVGRTLLPLLLAPGEEAEATGGFSLLAGGWVLAIMVAPTIAGVAREVLRSVPAAYREAAIALGATRWEVVRVAVLPGARRGLLGAVLLGLGRALGEATAMAMVLGARLDVPASLASPGYSAAALLLDQLGEATEPAHVAALGHLALVLLAIAIASHAMARALVDRAALRRGRRGVA